jgi:hypothetical protein
VRAEVVEHDGDADLGWMEGSHVAQEGQELGPSLLGLDVAVELVGGEVIGRESDLGQFNSERYRAVL